MVTSCFIKISFLVRSGQIRDGKLYSWPLNPSSSLVPATATTAAAALPSTTASTAATAWWPDWTWKIHWNVLKLQTNIKIIIREITIWPAIASTWWTAVDLKNEIKSASVNYESYNARTITEMWHFASKVDRIDLYLDYFDDLWWSSTAMAASMATSVTTTLSTFNHLKIVESISCWS